MSDSGQQDSRDRGDSSPAGQWYVMRDGEKAGPLNDDQLRDAATAGRLRREDRVWQAPLPQWIAAGSIPTLFDDVPTADAGRAPDTPTSPTGGAVPAPPPMHSPPVQVFTPAAAQPTQPGPPVSSAPIPPQPINSPVTSGGPAAVSSASELPASVAPSVAASPSEPAPTQTAQPPKQSLQESRPRTRPPRESMPSSIDESPDGLPLALILSAIGVLGLIAIIVIVGLNIDRKGLSSSMVWARYSATLRQQDGLLIYYPFETAEGDQGRGDVANHASYPPKLRKLMEPRRFDASFPKTLANQPVLTTGRWSDKAALRFDGSDDFLAVPHQKHLNLGGALTMVAWVQPSENHAGWILSKSHSERTGYELFVENGKAHLRVGTTIVTSDTAILPEHWHMVAGVIDPDNGMLAIVVDGQATSREMNGEPTDSPAPLYLGRRGSPSPTATDKAMQASYYWDGRIGEVGFFTTALAEKELAKWYEAGKSTTP